MLLETLLNVFYRIEGQLVSIMSCLSSNNAKKNVESYTLLIQMHIVMVWGG